MYLRVLRPPSGLQERYDNPRRVLLRHFLGIRREFTREQILAMSVDASTIGGLNRMLVFLTKPSNVACWMPLVVSGVETPKRIV